MKIQINKKNIKLYLNLIIYIIISGGILYLSKHAIIDILSMGLLVFLASRLVNFDLMHPFTWYTFFFWLYSIGYPVLYLYGASNEVIYTKELMITQWIALVTFLLVVTPKRVSYESLKDIKTKHLTGKIINTVMSIIIIITIYELSRGSHTNKRELYSQGSFITSIGFRAILVYLTIYTVNLSFHALNYSKLNIRMICNTFIFVFLIVYFSGERDILLRFVILTFYVYYAFIHNRKNDKFIFIMSPLLLSLPPLLRQFKYFGLTGKILGIENSNIIIELMKSDFGSASKNMQILLLDSSSKGRFKGFTIISDIVRSFKLDKLLRIETISSIGWFNSNYFKVGRSGQGFTIVGEGYINFGYLGIIIIFIIVGLLVRLIYRNSMKGIYMFSIYVLSIPIFIYAIRADLANILSPLISQVILVIIIIWVLEQIITKDIK